MMHLHANSSTVINGLLTGVPNGETVTLVYEDAMFVCLGEMFDELILTGDYCVVN